MNKILSSHINLKDFHFHFHCRRSGYGLALRQNSPFRTAISGAILKLQEEGKLHVLKTRWWKEKRGGGACRVSFAFSTNLCSANKLFR